MIILSVCLSVCLSVTLMSYASVIERAEVSERTIRDHRPTFLFSCCVIREFGSPNLFITQFGYLWGLLHATLPQTLDLPFSPFS